jgi:UPF0716 family protein affecting phage T7 exclusion
VGGLLFLPPFRLLLRQLVAPRIVAKMAATRQQRAPGPDDVIEGEWEEVVERPEIEDDETEKR